MSEQGNTDVLQPLPHPTSLAFDHGTVSRFNAWFFTAFARYINHAARHHKLTAFSGLPSGATILEIGAGTGANLHHLPTGTHLYAVEPSLRMHERLRHRCAAAGVDVQILATGAEAIPLPNASVDEVICSLVLCTARDPAQVLAEVRRVLRPGGRFRFVEHVASPHRGNPLISTMGDTAALGMGLRRVRPAPAHPRHHRRGRLQRGALRATQTPQLRVLAGQHCRLRSRDPMNEATNR